MNAKNLPLKFGFVALLIALSLYTLHARGVQLGIDLRGGHSLTFEYEIREGENEQAVAANVLETLKKRVDPQGLRNLEWRPQHRRIEIRMPAGSEESRQAKADFRRVMRQIEESNLQRSDVFAVLSAAPDQRAARIESLFGTLVSADPSLKGQLDQGLRGPLMELADQSQQVADARQEWQKAVEQFNQTPAEPETAYQAAERAKDEALAKYNSLRREMESLQRQVLAFNISPADLEGVLRNYVSDADRASLRERGEKGRREIERRQEAYQRGLAELKENHPARVEQIDRLAAAYEQWAEVRQYLDDPADLKRLVAQAGVLEFRIAPYNPNTGREFSISIPQRNRYLEILANEDPAQLTQRQDRLVWFPIAGEQEVGRFGNLVLGERAGRSYILLYNTPDASMTRSLDEDSDNWSLTGATAGFAELSPEVRFQLNYAGAQRMGQLTGLHEGHAMAVLLDNEVYSAPTIQNTIFGTGRITGDFTPEQVRELVDILNSGTLKARLSPEPVAESSFAAAIGEDNRQRGIMAAYAGLIAVGLFMLVFYMIGGAIADAALMLNILLVLGAMSMLGAVFTLPGIAGVILTIGIAVDANVLIFERLREEQEKGQSVRMALKNAYERAFSAIFDANLTTLITCLILAWVGTEEVRGFGITLGLGVVFSMFTALVVTRWVFQVLLDTHIVTKPIKMLRLLGTPSVNWMAKRKLFWGVSVVMIALGLGSLYAQKGDIWGIEFSSGTQALVQLRDGVMVDEQMPSDGLVNEKLLAKAEELNEEGRLDRFIATATVETRLNPSKVQDFLLLYDENNDRQVSRQEFQADAGESAEAFFAQIDDDGNGQLTSDELEDLPSTTYQVSTTETRVGLVREVVREAFGRALRIDASRDFAWVDGTDMTQVDQRLEATLGVPIAETGKTVIGEETFETANRTFQSDFMNYVGGVMLVAKNVEPPLTETELTQRVNEMRLQDDFAGQRYNRFKVLGLTASPDGQGYTSFAILTAPADLEQFEQTGSVTAFADAEQTLIAQAFGRERATPAQNFDAQIAGDAAQKAIVAVGLSWLAIVGYLWLRFGSLQWGLAAVICLIHDVVIVVGLVAASDWLDDTFIGSALGIQSFKIDLAMVAAILTVIGYSVNDTIVVFDRIRENRGKLTTVNEGVINTSINQTLSRTILTSGTTFIVVFIMYVWGGPGIHAFNYALLAGVLFGTYSSIAVASPLLVGFKRAIVAKAAPTPAE